MTLAHTLLQARCFAVEAHGDQRYGDLPYAAHLDAVRSVAFEHGVVDDDILVATLLHDAVEDTPVTKGQVAEAFGERVAALVDAVSDPEGPPDRAAKKKASYPRIRAIPGATTLKLADRLANVRACLPAGERNARKLAMYQREYPGFREALHPGAAALEGDPAQGALWEALDRLLGPSQEG